jgi:sortase A
MKSLKKHPNKLRLFNDLLTVVVISICIYVIAAPFWPQLSLWYKQQDDKTKGAPYAGELARSLGAETNSVESKIPDENRLVIPAISLNEKIYEGESENTVNYGVWRRPKTSKPDLGGNTVLVGHRFTYKNPAVFYHLDKVKAGDRFAVYWNKKELLYEVTELKVVPATAIEIEKPTEDDKLTIYTCTPIWTAKDRLVLVAKPIKITEDKKT